MVLARRLERIPPGNQLIDKVLASMAVTARNLWPIWFTDVDFGLGRSALDLGSARLRLSNVQKDLPQLSVVWGRLAISRAMQARLPLVPKLTPAFQLGQLSLAISSRAGLIVVLAMEDSQANEGQLLNLASTARWLAHHGNMSVAVALPPALGDHPALAHILFDPINCKAMDGDAVAAKQSSRQNGLWIWLGKGRTHPRSSCEASLAEALAADSELAPLFSAGQTVETIYRNRYTVDFFWPHGRVVVELDGADHLEPQKYAADRRRDFELLVSGFSVLRLVNRQVLVDRAKAIEQIRKVVNYRRQTCIELDTLQ